MQSLKNRILNITYDLIFKYGITSVTMDYIASQCGISKRTLYEQFSDKNSLVIESIVMKNDANAQEFNKLLEQDVGPLQVFLSFYLITRRFIVNVSDAFLIDVKRLYSKDSNEFDKIRLLHYNEIRSILQRGVECGTFRPGINVDIYALIYVNQMHNVRQQVFNDFERHSLKDIYSVSVECFLRGVLTNQGLAEFEKFKEENINKF